MRTTPRLTLDATITECLTARGAERIPPAARRAIDDDLQAACEALVRKRITGEFIGRMVMVGLTQPTPPPAAAPAVTPAPQPPAPGTTGEGL